PLAGRVRKALGATTPVELGNALVDLAAGSLRFLGIVLASMAMRWSTEARPAAPPKLNPAWAWLRPWSAAAAEFARSIAAPPGRVAEILTPWFAERGYAPAIDDALDAASIAYEALRRVPFNDAALSREKPRFQGAIQTLVAALGSLHGWTLVVVDRTDWVDSALEVQKVSYIDYTGSYERGIPRRINFL